MELQGSGPIPRFHRARTVTGSQLTDTRQQKEIEIVPNFSTRLMPRCIKRQREKEREREGKRESKREREREIKFSFFSCAL